MHNLIVFHVLTRFPGTPDFVMGTPECPVSYDLDLSLGSEFGAEELGEAVQHRPADELPGLDV